MVGFLTALTSHDLCEMLHASEVHTHAFDRVRNRRNSSYGTPSQRKHDFQSFLAPITHLSSSHLLDIGGRVGKTMMGVSSDVKRSEERRFYGFCI